MSVRGFTDEIFALIHRECPVLASLCAEQLGAEGVHIDIRGDDCSEQFEVRSQAGRLSTFAFPELESSAVRAATTPGVLCDLLDGSQNLEEALLTESIYLAGTVEQLACMEQALSTFVHAAVRSPSAAELWERFLLRYGNGGYG